MDDGPRANGDLIWMLGLELDDELLEGLTRAIRDGYLNWVVIPGAPYRVSTVTVPAGTFVP